MSRYSTFRSLALALAVTSTGLAVAQSSLTNSNATPWAQVDQPYMYAYRTGSLDLPVTYPVSTNRPDIMNLPASITLGAGGANNYFYYTTNAVTQDTPVRVFIGGLHLDLIVKQVFVSSIDPQETSFFGFGPQKYTYLRLPTTGKPGGFNIAVASSNPAVLPFQSSVTIGEGAFQNFFYFEPNDVAVDTTVRLTATLNARQTTQDFLVKPIFTKPLEPEVVELIGGTKNPYIYARLNDSARGNYPIDLSSSHPSILETPSSMTIGAGGSANYFYATTTPVSTPTLVTITGKSAQLGSSAIGRTTQILVKPNTPSINTSENPVLGGTSNPYHYVRLLASPTVNSSVQLSTSPPNIINVPSSFQIGAGAIENYFYSTSQLVPFDTTVNIHADYAGMRATVPVRVLAQKPVNFTWSSKTIPHNSSSHYFYVQLRGIAGPSGANVQVTSAPARLATHADSLNIGAGAFQNYLFYSVGSVTRPTYLNITATFNQNSHTDAVAVVPPGNKISGRVLWNGLADPATAPETVDLEFRQGATTVVMNDVELFDDLSYNVTAPGAGPWDISMKDGTWLRRTVKGIGVNQTFVDFNLINGDIDDDNAITVFDYIELSAAFDTFAGDPGFNERADLDRDGSVSVFDYILVSQNFDTEGDL